MLYRIKENLMSRGPVSQGPDTPIEGVLLVATTCVLTWDGEDSDCGHDTMSIFPAVYKGERCWLLEKTWQPGRGYCAEGTEESIISFEEGVKLLIKKEVFSFKMPE